jgi:hypothetical protein
MAVLAVAGVACSATATHPTKVNTGATNGRGPTVKLSSYQAAPVRLHVGQTLVVEVDPARLNWVGGDDSFAGVLKADNPCDSTCTAPARTFTAVAPGSATIETVVNCRDAGGPIGVMCARGPALDVKVTPATATGTLTGKLIMEGGAVAVRPGHIDVPPGRPIPGTVRFVSIRQPAAPVTVATSAAVSVGRSGRFTVRLAPGFYRVEACTPQIQGFDANGQRHDDCTLPVEAVVHAGVTTAVAIPPFIVP